MPHPLCIFLNKKVWFLKEFRISCFLGRRFIRQILCIFKMFEIIRILFMHSQLLHKKPCANHYIYHTHLCPYPLSSYTSRRQTIIPYFLTSVSHPIFPRQLSKKPLEFHTCIDTYPISPRLAPTPIHNILPWGVFPALACAAFDAWFCECARYTCASSSGGCGSPDHWCYDSSACGLANVTDESTRGDGHGAFFEGMCDRFHWFWLIVGLFAIGVDGVDVGSVYLIKCFN